MEILLDQFEQQIDNQILQRGLAYFKADAVLDFAEVSAGEYEAVVVGSQEYSVYFELDNNSITKYHCDCPYDKKRICKHIAAAIFYLKANREEVEPSAKPIKRQLQSNTQRLKELLKVVSHQELIAFIEEHSKNNENFRDQILLAFSHLNQDQSKEFYRNHIHAILKSAAGRDGFIYGSEMKYVSESLFTLLQTTDTLLQNQEYKVVYYIVTALLEEMIDAFEYSDDSGGDIGYFIDLGLEYLSKVVNENPSEAINETIFDYCIASFDQKTFDGWQWHLSVLSVANEAIINDAQVEILLNRLDSIDQEYYKSDAQSIKYDVLQRFKDQKEVEKFINDNISNSDIRTKVIEEAFDKGDFDCVVDVCQKGIIYDQSDKPGLVTDWYNWLLKVAQIQNDTSKIIEYSRFLLIHNFRPQQDYYQVLKGTIANEDWHPFLEEIITEITPQTRWNYTELVREIYIKEEWWNRLFLLLQQNVSMANIQKNEQYLAKEYSPELVEMYNQRILIYVEKNIGRSHYKTACAYLLRMKKLGGNEQVKALVDFFRIKYARRKALMEELNSL